MALTIATSTALSTLVSASREIVISIEAGSPVDLDLNQVFSGGAASFSDRGSSVVMSLEAYSECLPASENATGGVALIKAVCTRSGNAALIPLTREAPNSNTLDGGSAPTQGSRSITASITRSPERVVIAYDPTTLAATTTRFGQEGAEIVFFHSAAVASFAALSGGGVLEPALAALLDHPKDIIILRTGDDLSIGVLKSSNFAINTLAAGFRNAPDDVIVLSTVEPRVGFGFEPSPAQPTYGYTAGKITITDTAPAETRMSPAFAQIPLKYVFWQITTTAPTATGLTDFVKVFFGTTVAGLAAVPASEGRAGVANVAAAGVATPTKPVVSLVFNASIATSRSGMASDGGIYRG